MLNTPLSLIMNKLLLSFIMLCLLSLSGCQHLNQDLESVKLSYQKVSSDTTIYTNVVQILQNLRRDLPADVRLIVLQGRVLLVGYVDTSQEHINLINAIWKVKGVQEVIDHLECVAYVEKKGFALKNTLIKTQLDAMFLSNSAVKYNNFQYIIFKDNLYVLSYVGSEREKEAFFKLVRKTPSIQKVFFYNTYRH